MADPLAARAQQLRNIEAKTGQNFAQLCALITTSGLAKVGEQRSLLMQTLGLSYGDANTLALMAKDAAQAPPPADAGPLDAIYTGAKAGLRPLHEQLMTAIAALGAFEIAPKKSYISLRRKKQFAMLGPARQWKRRSLLAKAVVEGFGCTLPAATALTPAALQPNQPHQRDAPALAAHQCRLVNRLVPFGRRGDDHRVYPAPAREDHGGRHRVDTGFESTVSAPSAAPGPAWRGRNPAPAEGASVLETAHRHGAMAPPTIGRQPAPKEEGRSGQCARHGCHQPCHSHGSTSS